MTLSNENASIRSNVTTLTVRSPGRTASSESPGKRSNVRPRAPWHSPLMPTTGTAARRQALVRKPELLRQPGAGDTVNRTVTLAPNCPCRHFGARTTPCAVRRGRATPIIHRRATTVVLAAEEPPTMPPMPPADYLRLLQDAFRFAPQNIDLFPKYSSKIGALHLNRARAGNSSLTAVASAPTVFAVLSQRDSQAECAIRTATRTRLCTQNTCVL